MPYKTGSWGEHAKVRSKKRLEYFREYQRKRYALKDKSHTKGQQLGQGIPNHLIVETVQHAKGLCEICGKQGNVIHHKNGIHTHNVIENLQLLCNHCHPSLHNRGEKNGRWLGDDASPQAKYMRKYRERKRKMEVKN